MPRKYTSHYLLKKSSRKPLGFYKKKVKGKRKKVTVPIMPHVGKRRVHIASVLPKKKRVPSKPKTILPRHVMEERILSIARTHLDPLALQNLQNNLHRADDEKVEKLYKYWSKQGKKKTRTTHAPSVISRKDTEARLKIPKKPKTQTKMTHIEKMHLLASCKQFEIDPYEIDDTLTYYENKKHIQELAHMKGFSESEITSMDQEMREWSSQYEEYLNHLKGELELAGYEVKPANM